MAYALHDLELEGITIRTILSVHIQHKPGEHGVLILTADLGEGNRDMPVHETGNGQTVSLFGRSGGKKELLFGGILTKLEVKSTGKSFHVHLTAKTCSYLMDIGKKSRSFQNTSMTLGALVRKITEEYQGAGCRILFADSPLNQIAVQYQETDWQFLKRILAERYIPIACSELRLEPCIYAGVAQIPAGCSPLYMENTEKDMEEMAYWKEIGETVQDTDFIRCRIRLDNHVPLYGEVAWQGKTLTAAAVEYVTDGSVLYETVQLQKKSGILQKPVYPEQLVGSALEGTILDVDGEEVKIHLKIDDLYRGEDCYWFPFSTPSASPDGSGWYCMPEKGDQVRVYFPSKKTGEVIAVSAVSTYPAPPVQHVQEHSAQSSGGSGGSGGSSSHSASSGGGGSQSAYGNGPAAPQGEALGAGTTAAGMAAGALAGMAAGMAAAAAAKDTAGAAQKTGKDKMGDPTTIYLRTIGGQEVKLSPKGIEAACGGGTVKIEVLKSGKVTLYAQNAVQVTAKKDIYMKAKGKLAIYSKEEMELASAKGGKMILNKKSNVEIKGSEVHMN